tara:strand:- start:83 stop:355 length:273 start_codon:yes stop_codon:yes gene_type:complete
MYYEEENGIILIFRHNKINKNLPFEGWLHNCLFCETITSNYEDFYYKKTNIKILSCVGCKKSNQKEKYKTDLNFWIETNIPTIRSNSCCR